MSLIGSTFDDGEPCNQTLLAQLTDLEIWTMIAKNNSQEALEVPCPVTYSDQELTRQREDLAKWEKDIERKARVIQEVGAYTEWDGAVPPRITPYMPRGTPEEREQWASAWPFDGR
jgi:hypothetical protein